MNEQVSVSTLQLLAVLIPCFVFLWALAVLFIRLFVGKGLSEQTNELKTWIRNEFVAKELNDLTMRTMEKRLKDLEAWREKRLDQMEREKKDLEAEIAAN